MKELLRNWKSLLFNVTELVLILLSGYFLKITTKEMIIVLFSFCGVRMATKSAMHYKSWKKCLCWTLLLITSLFLLVKVNVLMAICMAVFSAIIISGKGDIKDCFMYRKSEDEQKYRELKRYVRKNKNTKQLEEFENILKTVDYKYRDRYKIDLYKMYICVFHENMSFEKIKVEMNLRNDNHIITNALDLIFISFNTYIETTHNGEKEDLEGLAQMS